MENSLYLKDLLLEKGYIRGPFGSALKRGEMKDSGIPVYEQSNAIGDDRIFRYFINEEKYNELKRFTVKSGDLVISCSGTVGEVTLIKPEDPVGIISQALLILRPNKSIIIPEYLMYFFKTKAGHNSILERSSGSVQVNIARREVIENIQIPCPNINAQRKIVAILSAIDDKIELNNRMNENLEEQAKLIYKNTFDSKKPNGILGLIVEENNKSKIKVGNAKGIKGDFPFFTSGESILEYTSFLIDGENCFLNTGGNADVKFYLGKASYSTDTWCIKGKDNQTIYLYILLKNMGSELNEKYFEGSALKHLQKKALKNKEIYIPNKQEIKSFNEIVNPIFMQISNNKFENKRLGELRDTLLPKLMSGEIDVSKVELKK